MNFKEFVEEQEVIFFQEGLDLINESLLDLVAGTAKATAGVMTVGDEALAKMVGQGTKGRMRRGFGQIGSGTRQFLIGKPKQKETKIKPTVVADDRKETKSPPASNAVAKKKSRPNSNTSPKTENPQSFLRELGKEHKRQQSEDWKNLVELYKNAKTKEERTEIRRRFRSVNPYLYQQTIEAGMRKLKNRRKT